MLKFAYPIAEAEGSLSTSVMLCQSERKIEKGESYENMAASCALQHMIQFCNMYLGSHYIKLHLWIFVHGCILYSFVRIGLQVYLD